MDARSIPFLVAGLLHVRLHGGQFSECLHSSNAAGPKHCVSRLALPSLSIRYSLVSQHPAAYLDLFAGQMRQLQSTHRDSLLLCGAAHRPAFPWPLGRLWPPIARTGAGLLHLHWWFDHFIIPDEITLGGIVVGFVCSAIVPSLHRADSGVKALRDSFLGIVVGGGLIYLILRVGKLLFGRKKLQLPAETLVVFTETAIVFGDQTIPFEDLFYRKSDTIALEARRVELVDRCYSNIPVRLTPDKLYLGDEVLDPETVPHLEVLTERMVLPQEAMGFGDVKFMAAIGAFLGWQATLFSLMVSSVIGAIVGLTLIVLKKQEWSSRLPYGPYIALAATIWVLGGHRFFDWMLQRAP